MSGKKGTFWQSEIGNKRQKGDQRMCKSREVNNICTK